MNCYTDCIPYNRHDNCHNHEKHDNCCANEKHDNCCNADKLVHFDGDMSKVTAEPVYVQKIYDAVLLNMQGLQTVHKQTFCPAIPNGFRLSGIAGIKCRKAFNPHNVNDPSNLTIKADTNISGASFVRNGSDEIAVTGPDGTLSERILYADTDSCCEKEGKGTPVFGTQNIRISGDVIITMNLILSDNCGRETVFPVSSHVSIAAENCPLTLTGFFEMCMPSINNSAFLPRFAEICNLTCNTRLATNNCMRDICISSCGEITANLIISLCVACEKKIIVPVELSVLSTGYVKLNPNSSQMCSGIPQFYPDSICNPDDSNSGCGCGGLSGNCRPSLDPGFRPPADPCCRPSPDPCCRPEHDNCCTTPIEPRKKHGSDVCDPFPVIG